MSARLETSNTFEGSCGSAQGAPGGISEKWGSWTNMATDRLKARIEAQREAANWGLRETAKGNITVPGFISGGAEGRQLRRAEGRQFRRGGRSPAPQGLAFEFRGASKGRQFCRRNVASSVVARAFEFCGRRAVGATLPMRWMGESGYGCGSDWAGVSWVPPLGFCLLF